MTEPVGTPRVPHSLVGDILGEQAARHMDTAAEIARRDAILAAKHKKTEDALSTIVHVVFVLGFTFALAIACLAMWNAVVG